VSRHRFDPFSFIAGAVSVGVALAVLLGQVSISLVDLRIAGPVLVLALGLALLLGGGRDRSEAPAEPDAPDGPDGTDR
jgi:small neutral amino acid transporter SnatA (MarC family)